MPSTVLTLSVGTASSYFFQSPENALVEDGTAAYVYDATGGDGVSVTAYYNTNATSIIPSNAKILGVEITAKASNDYLGYGMIGATISQTGSYPASFLPLTTTYEYFKFGSPTNNLGADSTIKLQILSVTLSTSSPHNSYLDFITATVYWEVPSLNVLFFGESF